MRSAAFARAPLEVVDVGRAGETGLAPLPPGAIRNARERFLTAAPAA